MLHTPAWAGLNPSGSFLWQTRAAPVDVSSGPRSRCVLVRAGATGEWASRYEVRASRSFPAEAGSVPPRRAVNPSPPSARNLLTAPVSAVRDDGGAVDPQIGDAGADRRSTVDAVGQRRRRAPDQLQRRAVRLVWNCCSRTSFICAPVSVAPRASSRTAAPVGASRTSPSLGAAEQVGPHAAGIGESDLRAAPRAAASWASAMSRRAGSRRPVPARG